MYFIGNLNSLLKKNLDNLKNVELWGKKMAMVRKDPFFGKRRDDDDDDERETKKWTLKKTNNVTKKKKKKKSLV